MANFENKILKKKKLDKEANLKISQNEMSGRIFVEFSSEDGKLVVQKSFQDTFDGNKDSQAFAKSIKSIADLRKYLGYPEQKPIKIEKIVQIELTDKGLVTKEKKNVFAKNNRRN